MMTEMIGPFPLKFINAGAYSREYFNRYGDLRNIDNTKYVGIAKLLHRKYQFSHEISRNVADFLRPMLEINPVKRATAAECLRHPFLDILDDPKPRRQHHTARHSEHGEDSDRTTPGGDTTDGRDLEQYALKKSKYQRAYRRLFSGQE